VALDFPRGPAGTLFAGFLDALSRAMKTPPNVVKDSRLPRAVARECHPGYEAFRAALARHDPERLYVSELSERLGL
jgi:decaprenylphospho-beta-D-ribofuranose 2-oxidase